MEITKGKWEVGKLAPHDNWVVVVNPKDPMNRRTVANLYNNKDDAMLVAAAPELYEAAKIALDLVETVLFQHPDDAIAITKKAVILKALAKAESKARIMSCQKKEAKHG